ncbi:CHAT domain-containing protein [Planktothrix sp. FACHB-1365]|uniref:CHAT domain-containing protein n=1 Tax=Planktothrix sp. FACHB-1365 TaxID=2692855 RepID=UPI00168428D9|nr:CHAT domain-containing tetratricopeptide repeat protein [Planktothrix sp. FACHB-1365]MBD2485137.1 CHAT domain-containing protein [Planktothrix sp. FACHB-1365]
MNEERLAAYRDLIQLLIDCPNGEEVTILQDHAELVDMGLCLTMKMVAETLTENGQEQTAQWLLNFAEQLMMLLSSPSPDDEQSNQYSLQDYMTLIQGLLQAEDEDNIEQLNTLLADNRHLLNPQFAEVLTVVNAGFIEEYPEATERIVALVGNISIRISEFPLGNPRYIQNIAIAGSEFVLGYHQEESELWAQANNNLGLAYLRLAAIENTEENLKAAIACYQQALIVYQQQTYPQQWAATNNNLGTAYSDLAALENPQENIKAAIACYEKALIVRQQQTYPQDWAGTNNNLGSAYLRLAAIENTEKNLKAAIACYQQALIVYQQQTYPQQWAKTNNNLGSAYLRLAAIENTKKNLKAAIACYQQALIVCQQQTYPQDWATTNNNLGTAYSNLAAIENTQKNLKAAIACYNKALIVCQQQTYPQDWAGTNNNLGTAYLRLAAIENTEENLKAAIACYNKALIVCQQQTYSQQWAGTNNNLGYCYSQLASEVQGSAQQNLYGQAVHCYRQALIVHQPKILPLDCVGTGRNFGDLGFKIGNWEWGVEGYEWAMKAVENSRSRAQTDQQRQEILAAAIGVYANAIQCYINLGNYQQALLTAERSRCRQLADLFASKDLYPNAEVPPELVAEYNALKQRMNQLEQTPPPNTPENPSKPGQLSPETLAEIEQLETERKQLWQKIRSHDPVLAGQIEVDVIQLAEIQQLIQDDVTAIVSFYSTNDQTFVFVLRRSDLTPLTPLPCEGMGEEFDSSVLSNFPLVSNSPRLAGEGSGERSYSLTLHTCDGQGYKTLQNWILQNWLTPYVENKNQWLQNMGNFLSEIAQRLEINQLIKEHLQGIEELIIIPHLYLHQMPFAALPLNLNPIIPSGETQTAKTRQMGFSEPISSSYSESENNTELPEYLSDRFRLRVVPSCQILKYCSDRNLVPKPHQLGIVENATGDLFYTEKECQELAKRYQVPEEYHLKKEQATPDNYIKLAKKVQRLHSSHHANADLNHPENCKLVLANKAELNLATIFTLRFPELSDLFLSCCETNLTLTPITDEPLSLAAGFLSAGARNVVSTLWAVEDQATSVFTILYYQYLDQGKTRPEALRLAQLDLRKCQSLEGLKNSISEKSSERLGEKVNHPKNSSEVKYPYASPYYWAGFLSQGLA